MRVHTIVISVQHDETITLDAMRDALHKHVIRAVVPQRYLDEKTVYHLQPSGRFVIGGPQVCVYAADFRGNLTLFDISSPRHLC